MRARSGTLLARAESCARKRDAPQQTKPAQSSLQNETDAPGVLKLSLATRLNRFAGKIE
jgi:hypothetical protein